MPVEVDVDNDAKASSKPETPVETIEDTTVDNDAIELPTVLKPLEVVVDNEPTVLSTVLITVEATVLTALDTTVESAVDTTVEIAVETPEDTTLDNEAIALLFELKPADVEVDNELTVLLLAEPPDVPIVDTRVDNEAIEVPVTVDNDATALFTV
ncbi:hypothetical protein [Hydromonas duriensis]|uniref:Uncharacterized protein n=1 Tax=Hydromonas duriensis TaxID=1527608 RepID=A0A4R6Y9C4_9BURK|nr:hypothetical protein [Hydromonas duriensis]TDR32052.1 hypothetical protein DFR44_106119 [Hydromonas duriensis]